MRARQVPQALPMRDLDQAVDDLGDRWQALDGMTLFFTGGTGFVGAWMTSVLLRALDRGLLSASVRLLSRSPEKVQAALPWIASHPAIELVHGDVLTDGWDCHGCTHLVAGATEASAKLLREQPRLMFDTILDGTRRTLDRAREAGIQRALFISSGAVHGPQPHGVSHVAEHQFFGPDPLRVSSAYAEGKRGAEQLFAFEGRAGLSFSVARLWAFVGPLLPLDQHLAVGNFLNDALHGQRIRIQGDGTTIRSYQYAGDMAAWCWSILASGGNGAVYNVGSEEAISMCELARLCADLGGVDGVDILGVSDTTRAVDRYVPSTQLIKNELGLSDFILLRDALRRTMDWYLLGSNS